MTWSSQDGWVLEAETFDPLDFFTAESHDNQNELGELKKERKISFNEMNVVSVDQPRKQQDLDMLLEPPHILDFPLLQSRPPYEVLIVFLRLLSPTETLNFCEQVILDHSDPKKIFDKKGLSSSLIEKALSWLKSHYYPFTDEKELLSLSYYSDYIKRNFLKEYNNWLTSIICNLHIHYRNKEGQPEVLQEASLRLAENCGRTAQPGIVRNIVVPELEPPLFVKLREPSLTNDNLGLKTWGASLLMARRLVRFDKGRRYLKEPVLELGAGTGLVGIVSSLLGFETCLTDLPEIVRNLKTNIELNNAPAQEEVLDWRDPSDFLKRHLRKFNTIILSDPIYSLQHAYLIFNVLQHFCWSNSEIQILFQVPLRSNFASERKELWTLMHSKFKEIENEIENGDDDFGKEIYCFKRFVLRK